MSASKDLSKAREAIKLLIAQQKKATALANK